MYYFAAFRSCVVAGEPACTSSREKPRVVSFCTFVTLSTYSWRDFRPCPTGIGLVTCWTSVLPVFNSNEFEWCLSYAFGMPLGCIDVLYDFWTILNHIEPYWTFSFLVFACDKRSKLADLRQELEEHQNMRFLESKGYYSQDWKDGSQCWERWHPE